MKAAKSETADPYVPESTKITELGAAAKNCKGCDLYKRATQTVFGEGPPAASMIFVGEQPGDQEDIAGKPFVGGAGKLLDRALVDAGIHRAEVYVTNAVKHFKWEPRGKRRLHAKPSAREITACKPWLEAEIAAIKPKIIVCLGATACIALMGPAFRLTKHRGEPQKSPYAEFLFATVHPSAVLRAPDENSRHGAYSLFLDDLKKVAAMQQSLKT